MDKDVKWNKFTVSTAGPLTISVSQSESDHYSNVRMILFMFMGNILIKSTSSVNMQNTYIELENFSKGNYFLFVTCDTEYYLGSYSDQNIVF
jgi:hypothetical protein